MTSEQIQISFKKYLERTITDSEYTELAAAAQEQEDAVWQDALVPIIENTTPEELFDEAEWQSMVEYILQQPANEPAVVHHIKSRKNWLPSAAAILLIIGIGTYFFVKRPATTEIVQQVNPNPVENKNDVAPGGNKATLTLADGKTIVLDSAANGTIAEQGSTSITKKGAAVSYDSRLTSHDSRDAITYNTMITPRGGQYQLQLPDGSKVWLNAESSITYPTAFSGKDRRVTISGELYFEVAKDKTKPFIVEVNTSPVSRLASPDENHGFQIEVLGTHFNINAYNEEPTINTTLLEGSVRLTSHVSRLTNNGLNDKEKSVPTSLILKPGQQGQFKVKGKRLSLAANTDIEQVMAWKNGAFNFQNVELAAALRQISRWYDVDVVYTSKLPDITLGGGVGRDLNLSEVLKILQGLGVKTRVEGRKLYISE